MLYIDYIDCIKVTIQYICFLALSVSIKRKRFPFHIAHTSYLFPIISQMSEHETMLVRSQSTMGVISRAHALDNSQDKQKNNNWMAIVFSLMVQCRRRWANIENTIRPFRCPLGGAICRNYTSGWRDNCRCNLGSVSSDFTHVTPASSFQLLARKTPKSHKMLPPPRINGAH